ncbi:RluA family pseudouridine synthase [Aliikangiella sp. G2MR2-5]|uniref:RluA family pseudouridine synthase n=1 Tax=Aliikangiella sp. G2MR2-5 TaxID=2788943 RepID=UPI0018AAF73B|nr:RluA family pseudouridine synthase [Aliikangiella sp. G2MR2-5]
MLLDYTPPIAPYLKILYRDDHLVVFDKPSGLLSVRGKARNHQDSLQFRAQLVWPEIGIVHRLDMSTSGIMLMALTRTALRELNRQFQQRETEKIYIARVWGRPETDSGEVNFPLIVDWPNRPKQKVCTETGKASSTRWRLLDSDGQASLLALYPITGRSHQLRVHMAEIGHPILGDKFYAHPQALQMADRLMLHAESLSFRHPDTGENFSIQSQCPF